jgi:hypothetical protein
MTYIVDTHVFVWFLDKNKKLKKSHLQILNDEESKLVFSTIVLKVEFTHLLITFLATAIIFTAIHMLHLQLSLR